MITDLPTARDLACRLNGKLTPIDQTLHQVSLLDFLRSRGLTGAKEGCAEGGCGACAVVVVEPHDATDTSAYRVVNSCLLPLPTVIDREIYTVESLASHGELADVQQALASSDASQCGYCTPGFVMSLFAEQYRPGRQGSCRVDACFGNLCRCTGYRPIRDAVQTVGPPPHGVFLTRLARPALARRLLRDACTLSRGNAPRWRHGPRADLECRHGCASPPRRQSRSHRRAARVVDHGNGCAHRWWAAAE
jgi:xanthine dehydrogenase iron-sulfur cluster and FAD-binding subunit A